MLKHIIVALREKAGSIASRSEAKVGDTVRNVVASPENPCQQISRGSWSEEAGVLVGTSAEAAQIKCSHAVVPTGVAKVSEGLKDLCAEEWALAIVVAYETGRGLTDAAKRELAIFVKIEESKQSLREILVAEGYGKVFGLLNKMF